MLEGRTLVVQSQLMNNDGQTMVDCPPMEIKCEKYRRFLPAGETPNGYMRADPLIQFWSERTIDHRGDSHYYTLQTVSVMSVLALKGRPRAKPLIKKRRYREQRFA